MPLRVGRGCSPGCRRDARSSRSPPGSRARPTRQGHEPDSLGIEHDAGRFAATQLADAGVPLPSGWRRLGDHPRRGLVLELPRRHRTGRGARLAVPRQRRAGVAAPLPPTWVADRPPPRPGRAVRSAGSVAACSPAGCRTPPSGPGSRPSTPVGQAGSSTTYSGWSLAILTSRDHDDDPGGGGDGGELRLVWPSSFRVAERNTKIAW